LASLGRVFLRSQIDLSRVAYCSPICNPARDARREFEDRAASLGEDSLPSFPCSIWSQLSNSNKVSALEISSRTELIVVSENAHASQKKKKQNPAAKAGGRLITNSEFVSCLLARRGSQGCWRGCPDCFPLSFNSIHSPICNRQLIKMIHRLAKLRHKWVVGPQMQRPYI